METEAKDKYSPAYWLTPDSTEERMGLVVVPCIYKGEEVTLLPSVNQTLERMHATLGTNSADSTLLVSMRRDFLPKDIRLSIKVATDENFKVLLFACDCAERAENVMNSFWSAFGSERLKPMGI